MAESAPTTAYLPKAKPKTKKRPRPQHTIVGGKKPFAR